MYEAGHIELKGERVFDFKQYRDAAGAVRSAMARWRVRPDQSREFYLDFIEGNTKGHQLRLYSPHVAGRFDLSTSLNDFLGDLPFSRLRLNGPEFAAGLDAKGLWTPENGYMSVWSRYNVGDRAYGLFEVTTRDDLPHMIKVFNTLFKPLGEAPLDARIPSLSQTQSESAGQR